MSLIIDETIQRGSLKEYVKTTVVESFGVAAVVASATKLAVVSGIAYSLQEMSNKDVGYNPVNGMVKLK